MSRVHITRRRLISTFAISSLSLAWGIPAFSGTEIALSFVHEEDRIDVPADAVRGIRAYTTQAFAIKGTWRRIVLDSPGVEICLSEKICAKLRQLTQRIVNEPIDIVVGCEVISSPIVREPMGGSPCIQITAFDVAEARALADKLRGRSKGCPAADAAVASDAK